MRKLGNIESLFQIRRVARSWNRLRTGLIASIARRLCYFRGRPILFRAGNAALDFGGNRNVSTAGSTKALGLSLSKVATRNLKSPGNARLIFELSPKCLPAGSEVLCS